VDSELRLEAVSESLAHDLTRLEPHGAGNPEPLFVTRGVTVLEPRTVGSDGAHLKMRVRSGSGAPVECIGFGLGSALESVPDGSAVDICCNVRLNEYNGTESAQLVIQDIRPAAGP